MSYEKKKLAGVLGNSHLGNYPYPPLPTSLMDQDHQDVYPMRMNPMQYPCNMQPPHPPPQPHPADQCLSTPQPPQTTEMVDDSCMVPVPQVVMDDHMTEPPDNLTMEDNYQNNENNITPANMDLPIQAEVVMEGPDNEDEQEQQDNDSNNLEKEKLPPKKHCFVCNTQLPQDIETAVPFFKTETTKTNKKFSAVVSKLVGRSITPRKAHSEIICRRCFNLLDRIDTLEVELKESKEEIVSNYKSTLEQYGGKTRRKRTVVSRKAAYLYRTTIAERTPRAAKKPKVVKQEVDPLTIQEVVGGAEAAAAVAAAATSEQSTSYAQSLIMDDNNMHHDDDDDDDDDDEDDDDDDDKKDSDNEPTTAGGKKRKRVRKFKDLQYENESSDENISDDDNTTNSSGLFEQYKCPCCADKFFRSIKRLKLHHDSVHPYVEIFRCSECRGKFPTLDKLIQHLKKIHSDRFPLYIKVNSKPIMLHHKCKFCHDLIERRKYRAHLIGHKTKFTVPCPVCNVMLSPKYLPVHMNSIHTKATTYACPHCPKVYYLHNNLKQHIDRHHDLNIRDANICDHCGKGFISQSEMKRHVNLVHLNVRKFVCDFCGKAYKMASALTYHRRTHTNEKPHNCKICNKAFSSPMRVSRHTQRVHKVEYIGKYSNRVKRGRSFIQPKEKANKVQEPVYSDSITLSNFPHSTSSSIQVIGVANMLGETSGYGHSQM